MELLAHGSSFVGRHLEMHKMISSCLHNQLTVVHGERGTGKSALILETARYMRQRNRFPNGIYCCSIQGLKHVKQVRTQLGRTLNVPVRSDFHDLLARYTCCLFIFDRCEDIFRHKAYQFFYFLSKLFEKSPSTNCLLYTSPSPRDS